MGRIERGLTAVAGAMLTAAPAFAQDPAPMVDRGDTGFILICAALV